MTNKQGRILDRRFITTKVGVSEWEIKGYTDGGICVVFYVKSIEDFIEQASAFDIADNVIKSSNHPGYENIFTKKELRQVYQNFKADLDLIVLELKDSIKEGNEISENITNLQKARLLFEYDRSLGHSFAKNPKIIIEYEEVGHNGEKIEKNQRTILEHLSDKAVSCLKEEIRDKIAKLEQELKILDL